MTISNELLDELLKGCKRPEDLLGDAGLMKELKVRLMERMLGAELTAHLGYEAGAVPPAEQSNRRNGVAAKRVKGSDGEVPLLVPRDRDGSFEPELVKKGQTRIDGVDDKIIGLYAAGLSVRDIQAHLEELYGLRVSPDLISRVTDAVLGEVREWQHRALDRMYPIVIFDALRVKIRDADSRMVKNKAVYIALGVTREGEREVLGLWIADNEGAKFWLSVMNELRNRGVQDILIAVVDGLKGFPEAITTAFPETMVQTCIEPPRVYRRVEHSKDEPYDEAKIHPRLSGRTARTRCSAFPREPRRLRQRQCGLQGDRAEAWLLSRQSARLVPAGGA